MDEEFVVTTIRHTTDEGLREIVAALALRVYALEERLAKEENHDHPFRRY